MRSVLDKLVSWIGLALACFLLIAGGLLTWANGFIGDQVHTQLVMQDITMPGGDALTGLPSADASALKKYSGSKLDTGPEAKAFADHYILVHMNEASGNRTYEDVSGEYIGLSDADKASADGQALGQLRQTLFMGNTLRGLLLYGYAFATVGTIAGIAAIASFAGGAILLLLVALGLWHARRTAVAADQGATQPVAQPV
ncbi:hypothetical protein FB382_000810 [Nocardioides ginsengisegetis]|uniref:Aromatic ring-opening dioxygenase LigA n=1 Tax=Nocardioides ginsengisegetis TaxID=661491 RepID=A0A7W3IXT5_9ACTN|nr:hypothetical protein [Nocardioides ginsengisegetis]MBA8802519.1 hypothetical protein [Nocardioides ginsengisegetis]